MVSSVRASSSNSPGQGGVQILQNRRDRLQERGEPEYLGTRRATRHLHSVLHGECDVDENEKDLVDRCFRNYFNLTADQQQFALKKDKHPDFHNAIVEIFVETIQKSQAFPTADAICSFMIARIITHQEGNTHQITRMLDHVKQTENRSRLHVQVISALKRSWSQIQQEAEELESIKHKILEQVGNQAAWVNAAWNQLGSPETEKAFGVFKRTSQGSSLTLGPGMSVTINSRGNFCFTIRNTDSCSGGAPQLAVRHSPPEEAEDLEEADMANARGLSQMHGSESSNELGRLSVSSPIYALVETRSEPISDSPFEF